jgi:hypothetical protein
MGNEQLKSIIRQTLQSYAIGEKDRLVFDSEHEVYQWLQHGWEGMQRIFAVLVHLELRQNLIWVECNNVEPSVVDVLLEKGVPKEQIVLGFQAPYKRATSGFAIGEQSA